MPPSARASSWGDTSDPREAPHALLPLLPPALCLQRSGDAPQDLRSSLHRGGCWQCSHLGGEAGWTYRRRVCLSWVWNRPEAYLAELAFPSHLVSTSPGPVLGSRCCTWSFFSPNPFFFSLSLFFKSQSLDVPDRHPEPFTGSFCHGLECVWGGIPRGCAAGLSA